MESRSNTIGPPNANDADFNSVQFEKRLLQLKDSQESINALSAWCLEHRIHHKKIVNGWLTVLKKVKVEHRLTLFYLANDVIQYSKRKNYDFVESWGPTLQKATTLVREEKVKNRILRIFKIWEQRGIYGEEFIADLSGLISASPTGRKDQDPQEFQSSYLITRIRGCAKLETDTDLKLKILKDTSPKITDSETLCASLKDRQHVEDVEKEVENGITVIEGYVNALKAEIKSRTHLISVLAQADTFYNTERKEVKVVVSAYKNFTTRVKNLKRKLDELIPSLNSPIPSPDINAPSPEPDSELELPNPDGSNRHDSSKIQCAIASSGVSVYSMTETYNAGYYTPASSVQNEQQNYTNNGFSSFIGSNMPFDIQNFTASSIFSEPTENYTTLSQHEHEQYNPDQQQNPNQSTINYNAVTVQTQPVSYNQPQPGLPAVNSYNKTVQQPLLPPPMPPFTTSGYMDSTPYTDTTYTDTYSVNNTTYPALGSAPYAVSTEVQSTYPAPTDAYNPEEELETWEPDNWDVPPEMETPESPPLFEKEGFADPIEYDDSKAGGGLGAKDIDHRVLLPPPQMPSDISGIDTDHRMNRISSQDVDHRNLISLTGSPNNDSTSSSASTTPGLLQPPPAPPLWPTHGDQDYRPHSHDQDYRVPADIAQQLKLPPPPPPPPKASPMKKGSAPPGGGSNHDNVESIDMELSDDENSNVIVHSEPIETIENNIGVKIPTRLSNASSNETVVLAPPPPIPENLCEIQPPNAGKTENGPLSSEAIQMLQHQLGDMNNAWSEDWFDGRPPPPPFGGPPPFAGVRLKNEFRGGGGFRGRGEPGGYRGRGGRANMRTRPHRGGFNNRGVRGFRGQFRGGY